MNNTLTSVEMRYKSERAKTDICYFAEEILGYKLNEWHRQFLIKCQTVKRSGGEIVFIPPRMKGRLYLLEIMTKYNHFLETGKFPEHK